MDHWLRKYLPVYQVPDAPAATPPEAPPAVVAAEPAPPVEPIVAESAPELPLETPVEPSKPQPQMVPVRVVTELRGKARDLENQLLQERRQRLDAEAIAEKLTRGDGAPAPQPTVPRVDPAQYERDVRSAAQEQRIGEDSLDILHAGNAAFKDFGDSRRILDALGAFQNNDFVADLLAVDKASAHVIIDKLAKDPERAMAVIGMDSRRRTAELTRMAMSTAAPTEAPAPAAAPKPAVVAKTVSRAPAPAPVVTPSAHKEVDGYSDEATDDQFTEKFNRRMKERAGAR